jgi:hypothetical protein
VLFDAWINYLIENDASSRLSEHFREFATALSGGANRLEQRFAKKLAILYAAGRVGVESGLLLWPDDWPKRAVRATITKSRLKSETPLSPRQCGP